MLCIAELCGLAETSEASDWWSLGALLFEILTGEVYTQACNQLPYTCSALEYFVVFITEEVLPTILSL